MAPKNLGWFGGKKAKGTVTVKPNSTLNVNYPSDANCFLIGKNGIKFINGNTKLIVYPNYFKIQAGTYGIAAKSGTDKKGLCVSLADDKLNYCHVGLENGNLKVDTQNITI